MRVLTYSGLSFVAACLVAGCGKSEGGGGDAPPVARADLAPQAAQVFCESFAGCCQEQSVPVDVQACSSKLVATFEKEWATFDANTTYNAQAAGQCLAALRKGIRCGAPDDDLVEPACEKVFAGKLKPGQPCTDSNECEKPASGSAYCDHSGQVAANPDQGLCTVEQTSPGSHAKLGEACISSCEGNDCESIPVPGPGVGDPSQQPVPEAFCYRQDGLYCAPGGTCESLIPLGGACSGSAQCAASTFCAFDTGSCSNKRPDGAACDSDSNCQLGNCQNGICGKPMPSFDACTRGSPL